MAPVIETSTTGRPASTLGTELFRFVIRITTRSMAFSVLLKTQAPSAGYLADATRRDHADPNK